MDLIQRKLCLQFTYLEILQQMLEPIVNYLPDCGLVAQGLISFIMELIFLTLKSKPTGRFSNGNVADYIGISYLIRQFLSLSLLLIWVFYVLKISLVFINYIICISFHWCVGH